MWVRVKRTDRYGAGSWMILKIKTSDKPQRRGLCSRTGYVSVLRETQCVSLGMCVCCNTLLGHVE